MIHLFCVAISFLTRPPIGANYRTNLNFLWIGQQNIELCILSKTEANITLEGIIDCKDTITYGIDSKGSIAFHLTNVLQAKLNKYRVTLSVASYESDVAQIYIVIKPIRFTKRVILHRSHL